jgi:hypothetical protein
MQPLAECMHWLQVNRKAVALQLGEPWLREYQVWSPTRVCTCFVELEQAAVVCLLLPLPDPLFFTARPAADFALSLCFGRVCCRTFAGQIVPILEAVPNRPNRSGFDSSFQSLQALVSQQSHLTCPFLFHLKFTASSVELHLCSYGHDLFKSRSA